MVEGHSIQFTIHLFNIMIFPLFFYIVSKSSYFFNHPVGQELTS